jgi:hypothetical protein
MSIYSGEAVDRNQISNDRLLRNRGMPEMLPREENASNSERALIPSY